MIKRTFNHLTNIQKFNHINALESINDQQRELIKNFISLLNKSETNIKMKNNMIDTLIKEKNANK